MSGRPTIHAQLSSLRALATGDAVGALRRTKKGMRESEASVLREGVAAAIESLEWLRDNREACLAFIHSKKGAAGEP